MNTFLIIITIIGILFSSAIGGLLLKILAKAIAKIDNATFKNSFLISLFSTIIIGLLYTLIGFETISNFSLLLIVLFNFFSISVIYILVSKLIWKCSFLESFKANIIWIMLYLIFLIITLKYIGQI